MACGVEFWDCPGQWLGDAASGVADSALGHLASAVEQAAGTAMASLGTLWTGVGTPDLTGGTRVSAVAAGSSAPGSAGVATVLSYVMWAGVVVAVVSLIVLGGSVAVRARRGDGAPLLGRIGLVLGGVVLVSGSSALVAGLLPAGPSTSTAGGPVLFLQSALWWYMGVAAAVSVAIAGVRMAWEQKAAPGRDLLGSLFTLVVVAGAGVTIIGLLTSAADGFSAWIIGKSLACPAAAGATCFGAGMGRLVAVSAASGGLGVLLVVVLGLFAVLASLVQLALMVARGGMLVILAGVLPLTASFTSTATGRQWFRKAVAWTVAFILYKPAAAIVYAAAFQLVGARGAGGDVLSVVTGLMLMLLALVALPALMRFVTPMVSATAGGGGAAVAMGAAAVLPTGAAMVGRGLSRAGTAAVGATRGTGRGGGGSGGRPPAPSPSGPAGAAAGGGGAGMPHPSGPSGGRPAGGAGTAGTSGATGAAGSVGGAGTSGVGAAGASSAGGGAAAGGAAAGPWGAAVAAAGKAAGAAVGAAKHAATAATGEVGGDPNGSI